MRNVRVDLQRFFLRLRGGFESLDGAVSSITSQQILKIYGERNTGTNYLEQLMLRNFDANILLGRAPDHHIQAYLSRAIKLISEPRGVAYRHAWRDRYLVESFDKQLGWKHMCPSPERLGPSRLANVKYVMVVKNPYSWALSLFRRPYHVGGRDSSFDMFLERKMPVMPELENIGTDEITPIEVWNRKVTGYLRLREEAHRSIIVRYEDLLADEMQILCQIAKKLGIRVRKELRPIKHGVKKHDAHIDRHYYQNYYISQMWRKKLTPQHILKINSRLDRNLLKELDYDILDPNSL